MNPMKAWQSRGRTEPIGSFEKGAEIQNAGATWQSLARSYPSAWWDLSTKEKDRCANSSQHRPALLPQDSYYSYMAQFIPSILWKSRLPLRCFKLSAQELTKGEIPYDERKGKSRRSQISRKLALSHLWLLSLVLPHSYSLCLRGIWTPSSDTSIHTTDVR